MSVNNINEQGMFIGSASGPSTTCGIESMNEASLFYPGQLGKKVKLADKRYQLVQVDSGATAVADVAPAASLLAYWKDKETFLVTTDRAQTEPAANNSNAIAGIFVNGITPGYYGFIHKEGKRDVNFYSSQTPLAGGKAIGGAHLGAGAEAGFLAAGSAATYTEIGDVMETGAAGATVEVDVFIQD